MVDAFLGKKYKLASSDKFDDYMKAVGVSLVTRKVGGTVSPVFWIEKQGGQYVMTSESTFKNVKIPVSVGAPVDTETPDGRKVKSTFTINGATIVENQVDADGKANTIERTWSADEIKMILKVDDIVCTRIYKAC